MKHIVKFTESDSWSGGVWYNAYDSEEEAMKEVKECNKTLSDMSPYCYIIAHYEGVSDTIPRGYKI